jgi:hypothetical protein
MAWPTTDDPRTVFVTIRLTADEASDLDVLVAATESSRSSVVRGAVDHRIATARKRGEI